MDVVYITNSYVPNAGGVATSVSTHLEAVEPLGVSCSVICPENGFPHDDKVFTLARDEWDAILAGDFPIACGRLVEKCDAVHVHGPFFLGRMAIGLAQRFGKPLIYTHHTLLEHYRHYIASGSLTDVDIVSFHTAFCNACDHVVAPSRFVQGLLVSRGVQKPISIVGTGLAEFWYYDAPSDDRTRLEIRKEYLKEHQDTLIGAVGRLNQEKNIVSLVNTLLDVLQENSRVHFLLIGEGSLESEIKKLVARKGLEHQFTIIGFVNRSRLSEIYKGLDAYVTSSHSEVQALTFIEAQAAGTTFLHEPSPVPDEFNMLCEAAEPEREALRSQSLSDKLDWYLKLTEDNRDTLRKRTTEYARQYNVARMGALLKKMYGEVILKQQRSAKSPEHPYWCSYPEISRSLMQVICSMEAKPQTKCFPEQIPCSG